MFLDLHDTMKKKSIFVHAPKPKDKYEQSRTKVFGLILDDTSDVFSLENCRYNNDIKKKNSARTFIFQKYKLADSFTLESSCFGFKQENNQNSKIVQFTPEHFIEFGKSLALATARHLDINVSKTDKKSLSGFKIELDYGLSSQHSLPGDHESWIRTVEKVKDWK